MPGSAERMWEQLGLRSLREESVSKWDWDPGYEIKVFKGEQLFPRIEGLKEVLALSEKEEVKIKKEEKKMVEGVRELITIDDFSKVVLKVGRVISAEKVERSEKLLKLKVDIGEERQIVAGIAKSYTPDDLIGKKVIVVSNLKPAKLMGIESYGMLLAATDEDGRLSVLTLDREVKQGARVK
jgi:methionyl-tRNA synthetase